VTANFALDQYTLTTAANPAAGGTVTGGGTYDYGTVVTWRPARRRDTTS